MRRIGLGWRRLRHRFRLCAERLRHEIVGEKARETDYYDRHNSSQLHLTSSVANGDNRLDYGRTADGIRYSDRYFVDGRRHPGAVIRAPVPVHDNLPGR